MIVLDTNVISELMRPAPDAAVIAWVRRQARGSIFTATLVEAEIYYGLELLPEGARKSAMFDAARLIFAQDFAGRILPFDSDAARVYGALLSARRRAGRPMAQTDAQIAAVARAHGAGLATRNTRDFADCGIAVVNPWTD